MCTLVSPRLETDGVTIKSILKLHTPRASIRVALTTSVLDLS